MMAIEHICRLCLRKSPSLSSLFLDNRAEMLKSLTPIRVCESDPSTDVCLQCLCSLKLAFKISQKMIQADEALKKLWANQPSEQQAFVVEWSPFNGSEDIEETLEKNKLFNSVDEVQISPDNNPGELVVSSPDPPSMLKESVCVTSGAANCPFCGKFLKGNAESNKHLESHFQENRKCDNCQETFLNFAEYGLHFRQHHKNRAIYKCQTCDRTFFYESLYKIHMETGHERAKLYKSVQNTNMKTTREQKAMLGIKQKLVHASLKRTISRNSHKTAMRNVSQSAITTVVQKLATSMNRKIQFPVKESPQELRRKFVLAQKAMFRIKNRLMSDLKSSHPHKVYVPVAEPDEELPAMETSTGNPSTSKLAPGCKTDKMEKCPYCPKEYPFKHQVRRHVETQHETIPQQCHLCGAQFRTYEYLRIHMYYQHNKPRFKCEHCGKLFKIRGRRDFHVKRDHLEKGDFVCDICGREFFASVNLRDHKQRIHEKLRPYPCDSCDKSFSTKYCLKTHQRQHTLETPYKCEYCGESFRQRISLRTHRKSKHGVVEAITCTCKKCGKGFSSSHALRSHNRVKCF